MQSSVYVVQACQHFYSILGVDYIKLAENSSIFCQNNSEIIRPQHNDLQSCIALQNADEECLV